MLEHENSLKMLILFVAMVAECANGTFRLAKMVDVFVMTTEIPSEIRGQYHLVNHLVDQVTYRKGDIFIAKGARH